ncbi:hypothetical protein BaRGS_00021276 [Batillaria attramentaria]|uniref:Uncharacterized protein n=1 Tax=Batillaria attramentaria TaxID=370345 RepID=A0ABD0KKU4_9CAEN
MTSFFSDQPHCLQRTILVVGVCQCPVQSNRKPAHIPPQCHDISFVGPTTLSTTDYSGCRSLPMPRPEKLRTFHLNVMTSVLSDQPHCLQRTILVVGVCQCHVQRN